MNANVLFDGSIYKMWYTGYDANYYSPIGYATSSDGINWTKANSVNPILDLGKPGSWDDQGVFANPVIFDGSIYKMWFSGWDETGLGVSCVLFNGTTYQMWYDGYGTITGDEFRIGFAEDLSPIPHSDSMSINFSYAQPGSDTLKIIARIVNPDNHNIIVQGHIDSYDSVVVDSTDMIDRGNGIWGAEWPVPTGERTYIASVKTIDADSGFIHKGNLWNPKHFTTIGSIVNDGYVDLAINPSPPYPLFAFKLILRNNGQIAPARAVSAAIEPYDTTLVWLVENGYQKFGDINPGEISVSPNWYFFYVDSIPKIIDFKYRLRIYSNGHLFWQKDSVDLLVGIQHTHSHMPQDYYLGQNHPNPYNPSTTIEFNIPKTTEVNLKIFNMLGEEVAMLVSDRITVSSYTYK